MQSRIEIFKFLIKKSDINKKDFSYSAIMRDIRKKYPDKVKPFMQAFKEAFEAAKDEEIDDVEQTALMQAIKTVNL
jgi:ABC-type nitrate/sulfonate/bicarbonate transport system substrate-binding protein